MTADPKESFVACLRSNWPDELALHAGRPPKLIDIPAGLAEQLLDLPFAYPLCELLEPELADAAPMFLKIAGFSFRGLPIFHHSAGKIEDIMSLRLYLRELPPRVTWGIATLLRKGLAPQAELHPWREIEESMEFRCFIKDGRLVGLSQYDPDRFFPDLAAQAQHIETELRAFVDSFVTDLHVPTVAADVYFQRVPGGLSPRLIELNPFGATTDKALFSGAPDAAFDGRFLYRRTAA